MRELVKLIAESNCSIHERRKGDQLPMAVRLAQSQYITVAYDIVMSGTWSPQGDSNLSASEARYALEHLTHGYNKTRTRLAESGRGVLAIEEQERLNFCFKLLFSILEHKTKATLKA